MAVQSAWATESPVISDDDDTVAPGDNLGNPAHATPPDRVESGGTPQTPPPPQGTPQANRPTNEQAPDPAHYEVLVVESPEERRWFAETVVKPAILECEKMALTGLLEHSLSKLPEGLNPSLRAEGEALARELAQHQFSYRLERLGTLQEILLSGSELPTSGKEGEKGYQGVLSTGVDTTAPWRRQGLAQLNYFLAFKDHERLKLAASYASEARHRFKSFVNSVR